MNPGPYPQQNYVMLNKDQGSLRPPPYRRNVSRYSSYGRRSSGDGGSCCLNCICCCYCWLFFLLILTAAITVAIYVIYQPKMPNYSIDSFNVEAFNVQSDYSLNAQFDVNVRANNPNERIAFRYGGDNYVIVMYSGTNLCSGKFPGFHQSEKNNTVIKVVLNGKSEFGSGLQEALTENRRNGKIPLVVKVKVPVGVVLGRLKLRQVNVFANCSLVLDSLDPNKKPNILSSKFTYTFGLDGYHLDPID
ncbi:NDR1/HIN1-like protein 6 [Ziziphus jujuba]|uniref:NDR1/HIN1-like protein 6 n=2 Tax=Ziziphus jujuba TaxID=326968 RepID=A0A6P3ZKD6_ZIZJJ|nr:NDR1/HIN1-like protein 6 [Ziziphus jujuba]KAH7532906.1 hypothetical protein FEM48_Zijuj04G0072100 [Ziziphus jujuba var. spinosa]